MKHWLVALTVAISAQSVAADIVVTTRTLRPGDLIAASDLGLIAGERIDSYDQIRDVAGQEARVALYPNRPIHFDHIGPPALVDRNQIVSLRFAGKSLVITTDGRSLERGGIGDRVRIMNLSSRTTLFGIVQADGSVAVTQ
jgi:flagella basal body P-ring formation protein FlgA